MPVPNLDMMTTENLNAFSERHQHGREYKLLFAGITKHTVPDTALLARFAHCKSCERTMKAFGDMPQSLVYQRMAAGYYDQLSPAAQWRKR